MWGDGYEKEMFGIRYVPVYVKCVLWLRSKDNTGNHYAG